MIGILGWRIEIYSYIDVINQKFKSGRHPLLIPNIPKFHYSKGHIAANTIPIGVQSKLGPLDRDSLLLHIESTML